MFISVCLLNSFFWGGRGKREESEQRHLWSRWVRSASFQPSKVVIKYSGSVQWASRKKRISYDFNFYVASTKH